MGAAMRRIRYAILAALTLSIAIAGVPARQSSADPPAPPSEYEDLYDELSQNLTEFENQLDVEWDEVVGPNRFAQTLAAANGNKAIALLSPQSWNGSLAMLDAYEAMGVEVVKLEVHYPLFTQAFHNYLAANPPPNYNPYNADVDDFIGQPTSFFNRIAAEIRSRGLGLWIEHGTIFPDYSPTPPMGYFNQIRALGLSAARQRYSDERSAEAALVVSQLAPDHYTILEEPDTQNGNFGYFPGNVPLNGPNEWQNFVEAAAAAIEAAAPASTTQLGAGMGTWDDETYVQLFAPMPELAYIDMHIYPLETIGRNYLQDALDWADYVRSVDPAKKLMIGEAWLYKASVDDLVSGTHYNDLFGRDVWSFWEPLDIQYHDVLFKLMHLKDFELVMPYWVQYYFYYIEYGDPTVEGMTGPQLITEAGQRAAPNLLAMNPTGTGEKIIELVAATEDTDGDGAINWTDANDDNDLLLDTTEAACGSLPRLAASVPERLDGTFAGTDDDGDALTDEPLPAGAAASDCDGDGYTGTRENHVFSYLPGAPTNGDQKTCQEYDATFPNPAMHIRPSKRWPSDIASSAFSLNKVNVQDLTSFYAPVDYLNTSPAANSPGMRFDLVPGTAGLPPHTINIVDLAAVTSGVTGAPPMLGGARAFNGPVCPWAP
jgi:hypothetical protein